MQSTQSHNQQSPNQQSQRQQSHNQQPPSQKNHQVPSPLKQLLEKYVRPDNPGLLALTHHKNNTLIETVGHLSAEKTTPLTPDTIFRLASMTKPITAAAAMILVQEKTIALDTPIDKYIPELSNRKVLRTINSELNDTVPAQRAITVRDLFTNTAGIGELIFVAPTCPLQQAIFQNQLPLAGAWIFPASMDEFLKRLGALPLAAQPGERWLYHMSSEILGCLIARVTGKTLETFMRERIFLPLGMVDTDFYVPAAKHHRLPVCYGTAYPSNEITVLDPVDGVVARPPLFESGAGGLVSTAKDLLEFSLMMLGRGRTQILSSETVKMMTRDWIPAEVKARSPFFKDFWATHSWGLGLGVTLGKTRGHAARCFGWDGAFGTSWWIDPAEDFVGMIMCQRRPDALGFAPWAEEFWKR